MAWGITRSAPVHPATASRRQSADRHHERSGSISRSRLMAVAVTAASRIALSEYRRKAVVNPLRQFLQPPFTRVERTILQVDERGHVQRLLVSQAALVAHRHVGPNESRQFLDIVESGTGVIGAQSPDGRNRAPSFAVWSVADHALALVDRLASRGIRVGTGIGQGRNAPAFRRTADDFALGKIADVGRYSQNLGGLFRRHDAVETVQKTVADTHADTVAYAVFCAPFRIDPGHVQRKPIRLRPAFQMATSATQRTAGVTPGVLVGLHH